MRIIFRKQRHQGKYIFLLLLLFLFPNGAIAGDLEEGVYAFESKKYGDTQRLLKPLANDGNPVAQFYFGVMRLGGIGLPKDEAIGSRWFQLASKGFEGKAQSGDSEALFYLGHMYAGGWGVKKDWAKATKLWDMAAKKNYAKAQFKLAVTYSYGGYGLQKDKKKASELYLQSAQNGFAAAQAMMGYIFQYGEFGHQKNI